MLFLLFTRQEMSGNCPCVFYFLRIKEHIYSIVAELKKYLTFCAVLDTKERLGKSHYYLYLNMFITMLFVQMHCLMKSSLDSFER